MTNVLYRPHTGFERSWPGALGASAAHDYALVECGDYARLAKRTRLTSREVQDLGSLADLLGTKADLVYKEPHLDTGG